MQHEKLSNQTFNYFYFCLSSAIQIRGEPAQQTTGDVKLPQSGNDERMLNLIKGFRHI